MAGIVTFACRLAPSLHAPPNPVEETYTTGTRRSVDLASSLISIGFSNWPINCLV
jgi:hypothetical protein